MIEEINARFDELQRMLATITENTKGIPSKPRGPKTAKFNAPELMRLKHRMFRTDHVGEFTVATKLFDHMRKHDPDMSFYFMKEFIRYHFGEIEINNGGVVSFRIHYV